MWCSVPVYCATSHQVQKIVLYTRIHSPCLKIKNCIDSEMKSRLSFVIASHWWIVFFEGSTTSETRHDHDGTRIFICRKKPVCFHSMLNSESLFVCRLDMWNSVLLWWQHGNQMLPYGICTKALSHPRESNFPINLCSIVKKDWRWFHVPALIMLLLYHVWLVT